MERADTRGDAVTVRRTTNRTGVGIAALALLSGCTVPGAADASPSTPARPAYTDEEVKQYKELFGRISDHPIPSNPDTLVDYGIKICDVIHWAGVDAAKDIFKKQADSPRDWKVTDEIARAATATLCSEFKGQWEAALPPI